MKLPISIMWKDNYYHHRGKLLDITVRLF